jgi:hypothetical protein
VTALQAHVGNRVVSRLVTRESAQGSVLQRSVDDVHRFIHGLQGRLRAGPGYDAAVIRMLADVEAFALQHQDAESKAELAHRAGMMRDGWMADSDLAKDTKVEVKRILDPIVRAPVAQAVAVPSTPAAAAAVATGSPNPKASSPSNAPTPTAPTRIVLTKAMRAVDVLKAVESGTASAVGLQCQWFESSMDKNGGYSTAYNLGQGSNWEIHVHRHKNGRGWVCTFQAKASVGNTNATRGMPLDNMDKLLALGVPKDHDPRKQLVKKKWGKL